MTVKRTIGLSFLAIAAVLLAAASISWSPAVTVHVTDASGAPASGAYLRYHYEGSILNFVDSLDYVARGSVITRAGPDGGVVIPGRLHVRSPLRPSLPPEVFVDHLYVPRLHNAIGPIPPFSLARPGAVEVEPGYRVTVFDVSEDLVLWESSLDRLYDFIRGSVEGRAPMADPQDGSAALVGELIGHLRSEHAALLERQQVHEGLSREPPRGTFERSWERRLKHVAELEVRVRSRMAGR